jgi:hypothetical protein
MLNTKLQYCNNLNYLVLKLVHNTVISHLFYLHNENDL